MKTICILLLAMLGCTFEDDVEPTPDASYNLCRETLDTCPSDTICISGTCLSAFPRVYVVTEVAVAVAATDQFGQSWDLAGGAPDLYLGAPDGTPITATAHDTFQAGFPGPFYVTVTRGDPLRIDAWDEDVTTPAYAFGCIADPVTAELLRSREIACSNAGGAITAKIVPRR